MTLLIKKVTSLQKEKEEIQAKLNFTTNELTTAKSQIVDLQNKFAIAQSIFTPVQSTANANNATVQPVLNNIQQ